MSTVKIFNSYLRIPLAFVETLVFVLSVYAACYAMALIKAPVFEYSYELISPLLPPHISMAATSYALIMMLSMVALGHYKSYQYLPTGLLSSTIIRVFVSLLLGSIAYVFINSIFPEAYIEPSAYIATLVISFLGINIVRVMYLQTIDTSVLKRNVLVIGAGHRAKTLIDEKGGPQDGVKYQIVGYLKFQHEEPEVPLNKLLYINDGDICEYVKNNFIDEVVLAIEDRRKKYPAEELLSCKLAGVKISDPVTFLEHEQGKVNLEMLHSDWMIYSDGFNRNSIKNILARLFDIVTSLTILLFMFPIMALTAFLISAESGFHQPIFYRQIRVGLDGKEFTIYKFRSMIMGAESNGKAIWAKKDDNRVTAIGRFIRKTRIDELPQIINILAGDMRLVGPRPERPEFVADLAEKIPHYKKRHCVKPGLAGWAQLNYPYGATDQDAYEKLQYDLYYVKNNNIILDLLILIQTVEIVIMGKGAR